MTRVDIGLALSALLLLVLHFALSLEANKNILEGAFFTSGSTIMSDGRAYPVFIRLQFHDNQVHDFEQINEGSQKFSFLMVSSFFGSANFLTNSIVGKDVLQDIQVRDRDIAFNYSYLSSFESKLTFYKFNVTPAASCFYIKELGRVWCLGAEGSPDEMSL